METHGGYGLIYEACYRGIEDGVVFEKDQRKTSVLVKQRPTWGVYEGDCVAAIRAGIGQWWPVNLLDCDPYGEPWPVLSAFFGSERPFPSPLAVVVTDGLRQKIRMNGGWDVHSLRAMVERYGADSLHDNYLLVCQEMLATQAAHRGYALSRWAGYYCGAGQQMTHYAAIFTR